MELKVLNAKELKQITRLLGQQFGFKEKLEHVVMLSGKDRLYIANREVFSLDFKKLNVSSVGMYFGEMKNDELRLSIEGIQLVGPKATKGVVEIDSYAGWMKGEDVPYAGNEKGFVIIRYKDDFLGCGKVKEGKILNFVGKVRRVK